MCLVMVGLNQKINLLKGVGSQTEKLLKKTGITTLLDLLLHLPVRYENRSKVLSTDQAKQGEHGLFEGVVIDARLSGRGKAFKVTVRSDCGGLLVLVLFHFKNLAQSFRIGRKGRFWGRCRQREDLCTIEIAHPQTTWLDTGYVKPSPYFYPIYPAIAGIHANKISSLISQALEQLSKENAGELDDVLGLSFEEAVRNIHFLSLEKPLEIYEQKTSKEHERIKIEELVAHRLGFLWMRSLRQQNAKKSLVCREVKLIDKLISTLPFQLSDDQNQVIKEIGQDMSQSTPMLRLLQGDVGCGKTVVAIAAMLQACGSGYQAALMVPIEVLAEQHYQSIYPVAEQLGVSVQLIIGGSKRAKTPFDADILIGTHALFHMKQNLNKLALIVVDEQHRFGVEQRLALLKLSEKHTPHQLMMSATPIPRTQAMTMYGDLECSTIRKRPSQRKPIKTVVTSNVKSQSVMDSVLKQCTEGHQAYWVCPTIEDSEKMQLQSAETRFKLLMDRCGQSKVSIGLLHGRMKNTEKQATMACFKRGEIQLLVATTVIEVGVDVSNATIMVIEHAECFGLAQVHQLRGRVGRGDEQSYCVLLYGSPLAETARKRLSFLRDSDDGFYLAEQDLKLRGSGEILGTQQSGHWSFRVADIVYDEDCIAEAEKISVEMLQKSPQKALKIIEKWHPIDIYNVQA